MIGAIVDSWKRWTVTKERKNKLIRNLRRVITMGAVFVFFRFSIYNQGYNPDLKPILKRVENQTMTKAQDKVIEFVNTVVAKK